MNQDPRNKFKPQDLGPLSESIVVPDWIGLEDHKNFIICVWVENSRPKSGYIDSSGTWYLNQL